MLWWQQEVMWMCFFPQCLWCQTWHTAWIHDNKIYFGCYVYTGDVLLSLSLTGVSQAYHWHIKINSCFFRKCGWRKERRVPDMNAFPSSISVSSDLLLCASFPGSSNKQNSDLWSSPSLEADVMWWNLCCPLRTIVGFVAFCRQIR